MVRARAKCFSSLQNRGPVRFDECYSGRIGGAHGAPGAQRVLRGALSTCTPKFGVLPTTVVTSSLPAKSVILRDSLLKKEHFRALCETMAAVLADGCRAVEAAVSQVPLLLSQAVKMDVESMVAASSSCSRTLSGDSVGCLKRPWQTSRPTTTPESPRYWSR